MELLMGIAAGVIGLPNAGKSTIFNALCNGNAAAENYPFCTIDPNRGIVAVPDTRLQRISAILPAEKVVPAFLELVDIAGLVRGASKGEGLGNQFLGHIKNVNALVHVVRCFEMNDLVHVYGSVDPLRDVEIVNMELLLKDLDTVERGLERMKKAAKSGVKDAQVKIELFGRVREMLNKGIPARKDLTKDELEMVRELNLLTAKEVLYIANTSEEALVHDNSFTAALRAYADSDNAAFLKLCGTVEAELGVFSEQEQREFLESLGLQESGLVACARSIYSLLGLQTFFSTSAKENRAWTVAVDCDAVTAAGAIHTDFAKGFIKAEVYTVEDLQEYGSEHALRTAGKIRQEGRNYRIQDGDIIFFRFNRS